MEIASGRRKKRFKGGGVSAPPMDVLRAFLGWRGGGGEGRTEGRKRKKKILFGIYCC